MFPRVLSFSVVKWMKYKPFHFSIFPLSWTELFGWMRALARDEFCLGFHFEPWGWRWVHDKGLGFRVWGRVCHRPSETEPSDRLGPTEPSEPTDRPTQSNRSDRPNRTDRSKIARSKIKINITILNIENPFCRICCGRAGGSERGPLMRSGYKLEHHTILISTPPVYLPNSKGAPPLLCWSLPRENWHLLNKS